MSVELPTITEFMKRRGLAGGVCLDAGHQPPTGSTSDDARYQIGEMVGRGGMGAVVAAVDLNLARSVALKTVVAEKQASKEHLVRFRQEARLTGQLEHPNIVPVHELGEDDAGRVFYTMKLVKGITLHEVLESIKRGERDMIADYPLSRLLTIFQKVCDAVAFAHSKGVMHRDLKPENIMIGDYGEVLVMDWGLAKVIGQREQPGLAPARPVESSGDVVHTMDGRILGSPHYMAPEQAEGLVDRLDARTDIFALGGILYCILCLHPPLLGASPQEVMQNSREGRIPPLASQVPRGGLGHCSGGRIPASLAAVATKALSLLPGDRYQNVKELQREVEAYQTGFATAAEQAGAGRLLLLLVKRHPVEAVLILGSILLIVSLITGFSMNVIRNQRQALANLSQLGRTAPPLDSQAAVLVDEGRFEEALAMISHATALAPNEADYHVLHGHILQSLLRMNEARDAYTQALRHDKSHPLAAANLQLCSRVLAENDTGRPLRPASLQQLQAAMLDQRRFAEAVALLKHLGHDRQRQWETWKTVLNRLGIATAGRLTQDGNGLFQLDLSRTDLDNLGFLRGMPLSVLNLGETRVNDLRPLEGMPLTVLNLARTEVSDLSPLRGMPLTKLELSHTKVSDLSPLRGMPLKDLNLQGTLVRDLAPLKDLPLTGLSLAKTEVADLSPLQGASLKWLELANTKVADLSPLRGMPLKWIDLARSKVADLGPLRGMSLNELNLTDCRRIKDLSPLRGMPLRELRCEGCARVTDVRPLAYCTELVKVLVPAHCENLEPLRSLPNLRFLNDRWDNWQTTAADFWKQHDARGK